MPTRYDEGAWAPAYAGVNIDWSHGIVNDANRQLAVIRQNALGGSGTGSVDWNSLESVQNFRNLASQRLTAAESRLSAITPEKDFKIVYSDGWELGWEIGFDNPYYRQGLGPRSYKGMYQSDRAKDEVRWYEASERKFALREQELMGIASAGGQEAFDGQQTQRAAQGVPFAQGARAAELLRQNRGPRTGGGAPQGGAGRQANRARTAEGRRFASNDRTTGSGGGGGGGSTATRRLRAANLMRQPLGSGSQSAAQLLG